MSGRTALALAFLLAATVLAVPPPEAGVGIASPFIPSAGQIAALNALHPVPFAGAAGGAAGAIPGLGAMLPAAAPAAKAAAAVAPPTVPPAVASLIQKYQAAATAFAPPPTLLAAPAKALAAAVPAL